ncbi:transposase, partial [Thiofilum flexile]|uniref:transposase n=1 Tax=Thiofilum flexile TaxID=125627 RepID=UPI00035E9229
MSTTKTTEPRKKAPYIRHSREYKEEALKLAATIGMSKAAKQLGLHESQLYQWRKEQTHAKTVSEREANLAT